MTAKAEKSAEAGAPGEEALEALAERLHWKMEHLDPTGDPPWGELSDDERRFYKSCVRAILEERWLVNAFLKAF